MAYFDSDGVQIYFEEHGKGEPVCWCMGLRRAPSIIGAR